MSTIPLPLYVYGGRKEKQQQQQQKSHRTNIRPYERTVQCPKQPILMNYKLVACKLSPTIIRQQSATQGPCVCVFVCVWPNRMVAPVEEVVHIGKWHSIVLIIMTIIIVHHARMLIYRYIHTYMVIHIETGHTLNDQNIYTKYIRTKGNK